MQKLLTFALSYALLATSASAQMEASAPWKPARPANFPIHSPPTAKPSCCAKPRCCSPPYSYFGYSTEQINKAYNSGLRRTDLPSIGSGLTLLPDGSFMGITDRGPNEDHKNASGKSDGKVFARIRA